MARRTVDPEEFRIWLTPAEALGRLPAEWPEANKRRWITDRLKKRYLRSAARDVSDLGGRPRYLLLAWTDWIKWPYEADDHFWLVGDYAGVANSPLGPDEYLSAPFDALDVRFDPGPFDERDEEQYAKNRASWAPLGKAIQPALELIQTYVEKSAGNVPSQLSRDVSEVGTIQAAIVRNADVQAWYASLSPENQALSQRNLLRKAKVDLGPKVARKQIEPFTEGRRPGRRPKV